MAKVGRKLSEEHKRKIGDANRGRKFTPEQRMNMSLARIGNKSHLGHKHFIIDFYLPEYQLVVECNGSYWHKTAKRLKRDKELEEYVLSKGKDILWLWDYEINDEWFDIPDYLEIEK